MERAETTTTTPEESAELAYDALWHLSAIGVLTLGEGGDAASRPIVDTIWDRIVRDEGAGAGKPATVALIDVGVGSAHPNLEATVDTARAIDFAVDPDGVRYAPAREGEAASLYSAQAEHVVPREGIDEAQCDILRAKLARILERSGATLASAFLGTALPAHGTAIAGLIVGDPGFDAKTEPAIAYAGVDPFSRLVPIRTGFDPDPGQLVSAVLYAALIGADVIVVPREFPDPLLAPLVDPSDEAAVAARRAALGGRGERAPTDPWEVLRALLVALSRRIPIVAAAGNSGEGQLIYPAALAALEEPNGIVCVGAVTAQGRRAGYGNTGGITLVAPSDDAEVFTRDQVRLDPARGPELPGTISDAIEVAPFSRRSIVTTDLPGAWGYVDDAVAFGARNPAAGLYAAFGGTSAAAVIVGGVVALCVRAARGRGGLDGLAAKSLLCRTARHALLGGGPALVPDRAIGGGGSAQFGHGLVDAAAAVADVLARKTEEDPTESGAAT